MQEREKDIEKWIGDQVMTMGCLWLKWTSPGNAGVPDRIVILPGGRVVFAEIKTRYGKVAPIQEHTIGKMREMGCSVHLVRGSTGAAVFVDWLRMAIGGRRS